jgi:nucleoside-diphosphate-sugar epimerase
LTEPVDYAQVGAHLERTRGMRPVRIETPFFSNLLDNAKARLTLGWSPTIDLPALCDRAFEYVRAADDPRKIWSPG